MSEFVLMFTVISGKQTSHRDKINFKIAKMSSVANSNLPKTARLCEKSG